MIFYMFKHGARNTYLVTSYGQLVSNTNYLMTGELVTAAWTTFNMWNSAKQLFGFRQAVSIASDADGGWLRSRHFPFIFKMISNMNNYRPNSPFQSIADIHFVDMTHTWHVKSSYYEQKHCSHDEILRSCWAIMGNMQCLI